MPPDPPIAARPQPNRRSWFAVWTWPRGDADEEPHSALFVGMRCLAYFLLTVFFGYYVQSIISLPLADRAWLGEIPLFALIQLPKITLNRFVQQTMIGLLPALGLASGSASPDRILTHPWALGVTVIAPGLAFLALLSPLLRFVRCPRTAIAAVIAIVVIDAALTFWFDATSRLSIF